MNQELKINLTVDAATGIATLKSFGDNADAHLKRVEGAGQSMATSLKSSWIAASAAIGAAGAVMYKAWNLAEMAAQFEEMEAGLQGLSARYGMTAESAIQMAKAAVDGQLSMMEAGKLAAKSFALGLNPDQVKDFLVQAERLTDVMGGQIPEAFEAMEKAAATGRSKGLVQYGINVDLKKSLEDYAAAHGIAKESISASTAMQVRSTAVMEATKRVTDQLGEATTSTADRMNNMRANVADIELIMGQFAIRGGAAMIGTLAGISAAAWTVVTGVMKVAEGVAWAMSKISGGEWNNIYAEVEIASTAAWATAQEQAKKGSDALKLAFEERKVLASSMKKLRDEENKEVSEGAKKAAQEREQATKSIVEEIRKANIDIEGIGKDQFTKDMARLASEVEKYKKAGVDKVLIAQYVAAETTVATKKQEEETLKMWRKAGEEAEDAMKKEIDAGVDLSRETLKRINERGEAARDLYKDMKGYEDKYFDESIKLIDDQATRYRELGIDEVAIAKWVANETEEAEIAKLKASGNFFDGMAAGLKELERGQMTWSLAGVEIVKSMSTSMASSFSTMFEDIYKGKMQSIGDYTGAIWDAVRKKFFDTAAQMAADEVILFFKTTWSEGGANVLGIINKVLGLASSLDLSSDGGGAAPIDTSLVSPVDYYAGGRVNYDAGGAVRGSAMYPGDHPGNDTVPAWLSPGEVVIRRTSVNPDTAAILDYINRSGRVPGMYNGGSVAGMVTEQPGRGYWGFSDLVSILTGGVSDVVGITQGGIGRDIFLPFLSSSEKIYNAVSAGNWADAIDAAFDPITGPGIDNILKGTGKLITDAIPWFGQLVNIIAPIVGAVVGGVYGGPGGAAGGGAAGSMFASKFNRYENEDALIKAGITAAVSYVGGSMSGVGNVSNAAQITSDMAGNAAFNAAIAQGAEQAVAQSAYEAAYQVAYEQAMSQALVQAGYSSIKTYVQKWVINEALGAALGKPENGQMSVSYEGANDNGLLASLSDMMGEIAPQTYAVSARNGIDYIPRDNFLVNAHEGEAVLTKKENAARKKEGVSIVNHFNFPNALTVDRSAINNLAEKIYPRLKRLEQWGH
jgi:hypothetical protein